MNLILSDAKYPDRSYDILDLDFTEVFEAYVEPVSNLIPRRSRQANAAWFTQVLEPGSNVDAVAQEVAVCLDNLPEIDTYPILDPLGWRHLTIALAHAGLNVERTAKRIDHTGKLDQQAIACGIRNTPSELLDLGVDQVCTMAPQGHVRTFFISCDEPRIAGDICRDDRCQPTRYTFRAHILRS